MKIKSEDKNEYKISFISLEIVDIRDIENTRDKATLSLDVIDLKVVLI